MDSDPGRLSQWEFRVSCQELIRHSDVIGDGWAWRGGDEEGFLAKTRWEEVNSCDEASQLSVAAVALSQSLRFDHHVVYSASFAVPVLYTAACRQDGSPLSLEELRSRIPKSLRDSVTDSLTPQEHPLLGCPCFWLHPCRTSAVMRSMMSHIRREGYVAAWLSVIGPHVGLSLPISYAASVLGPAPSITGPSPPDLASSSDSPAPSSCIPAPLLLGSAPSSDSPAPSLLGPAPSSDSPTPLHS
uniref:Ubiquitin-like-conjugating enzyme ATG10 n=1 Tax=Petromyzon marinus TaxID=7757 RepID=A0AAJ7SL61_PETMA|nr:ubiquitin-like-conjugating enzyme ATG10 [Petromyzon marinus]